MATLAEIRAKLLSERKTTPSNPPRQSDGIVFPHWNAAVDTTQVVRFLPDADAENTFFWREKAQIKLKFESTDDKPEITYITLPCMDTWGEKCPLKALASEQFKLDAKAAGKMGIWPKRSYYLNCLVRTSTLTDDKPASPIRLFIANQQLFKIISDAIMDAEIEHAPTDYKMGRDFRVKKTQKGDYADYTTSSFSMKPSELTKEELDAIGKNGLYNLGERMGKKPTQSDLDVYVDILTAYIDGQSFDSGQWGKYLAANKPE